MEVEKKQEVTLDKTVSLTKREMEVFTLITDGKTSQQVADILVCSKRTVDAHLTRIYDKLCVSNRVKAFRRAVELGICSLQTAA